MAVRQLFATGPDSQVAQAVRRAKQQTNAEIVVAVHAVSADYRHADLLSGMILSVMGLFVFIYHPQLIALQWVPVELAVLFALGAASSRRSGPIRRALTSSRWRQTQALRDAHLTFRQLGVDRTRDRTGVLVLVSALDQQLTILCDRGIDEALMGEPWQRVQQKLALAAKGRRIGAGDLDELVEGIEAMGSALARCCPKQADDTHDGFDATGLEPSRPEDAFVAKRRYPPIPVEAGLPPVLKRPSKRSSLQEKAAEHDPEFSLILFEDFLHSLFAEAHRCRPQNGLATMAPYLSEAARASLSRFPVAAVDNIIVGGMRFDSVWTDPGPHPLLMVQVTFEADYTEVDLKGRVRSWIVEEKWTLQRPRSAKSRAPERTRVFGCPNCAAPLKSIRGRICDHCGKTVDTGGFDWFVVRATITDRTERAGMLSDDAVEVGTHDPTLVDPASEAAWDALVARDRTLTWEGMLKRVRWVFDVFHSAWNAQDMLKARAVLSDHLFQAQTYWIDAYQNAGLNNCTRQAQIHVVVPVQVLSDKHYDAVMVRVFASCLDFTVDRDGKVVAGSDQRPRQYSEYWTFIRNAARTGEPKTDSTCANCGAPMDLNMAGHCKHCKARIGSGEFDWVLSRIEQDESYEG